MTEHARHGDSDAAVAPFDVAAIVRNGFDTDPRAASFTPAQREIAEATMIGVCEGMIEAVRPLVAERDRLREEAHRFRDLAARAWPHMHDIRAESWLRDYDIAESKAQSREAVAAGIEVDKELTDEEYDRIDGHA